MNHLAHFHLAWPEKELLAELQDQMPEMMKRYFTRNRAIELRRASHRDYINPSPGAPEQHIWIRPTGKIPDDPAVHHLFGIYLHKLNRNKDALTYYDRALELNEQMPSAHYNRGLVLFDLERYNEAMEAATRAADMGYPLKGLLEKLSSKGLRRDNRVSSLEAKTEN